MTLLTNWAINDVSQKQHGEKSMAIYFSLNDVPYLLRVKMKNGFFKPRYVAHQTNKECAKCQLKGQYNDLCHDFDAQVNELFLRLIEFPSIRLEWLYLPHVEKE